MRDAPLAGLYVLFYEQAKTYLGSKSPTAVPQDRTVCDFIHECYLKNPNN